MTRAIDCLVNVDMGDAPPPAWMIRVKEDTFKAGSSFRAARSSRSCSTTWMPTASSERSC